MCSFVCHITQIQCLGCHKIVDMWVKLNKYEEFLQCVSPILYSMDTIVPQSLLYIFMGEYFFRCAHFNSPLLVFSVLVIIKQQKNGSSSIIMKNYHSIFPHSVYYGYHCRIQPLVYILWVNISSYVLSSIPRDSFSVYWSSKNSINMALAL